MRNLVLVESPTKAKTISKFLGSDYKVIATKGHVRDLPKSSLGVDVTNGFKPEYVMLPGKNPLLKELKSELKKSDSLILAPDPDREGEAIAWHTGIALGVIDENLNKKKNYKNLEIKRIVFHEITKQAILDALKSPKVIDLALVNAQQARRILDRLVGYKLSPLLWSKIRYGLSAGRVQSIAVKIIVDRERERKAFNSEEYWSVDALFKKDNENNSFRAELAKIANKNIDIKNDENCKSVLENLQKLEYKISKIQKGESNKKPPVPFTTSSLQQEANKKLGFPSKRTMFIAQKLYEGISIGKEPVGLITYMRTDSIQLATSAIESIREYIKKNLGEPYLPEKAIFYKNNVKSAQEAHEGIRPTQVELDPESIKKYLTDEQFKLYSLIWKRSVASQMNPAKYETLTIEVTGNGAIEALFRASGQKVLFDGYRKVYSFKQEEEVILNISNLEMGDLVNINDIKSEQHFTQPPARYSEASLIKFLEKNGIGRPSTYSTIITTIQTRGYVTLENKYFIPTDTGTVVNELLEKHFPEIVDINFTSQMEDELDGIATGKENMQQVLSTFYFPFEKLIEKKQKEIKKEDLIVLGDSDEKCPDCGSKMVIKLGKYGKFLSCSNFPQCKGMKALESAEDKLDSEKYELVDKCDLCGSPMILKRSKFGKFWACSNYPKCKNIKPLLLKQKCPNCGKALTLRNGKFNKSFYGCSGYPDCKYHTNKLETESEKENVIND